jgi:single-stranded-DNA-specific exonuclease
MNLSWKAREIPELVVNQLRGDLALPDYVLSLLASRGWNNLAEVQAFMHPKLSELRDPMSMIGMLEASDRFVQAFQNNEKICVYADFDLDGTSGLALMLQGLKNLGFKDVVYAQPKRLSEGYGFHSHIVEELKTQGVSLIVTVDVGITAYEACDRAKQLGIDVIITDHHQVGKTLPEALTVVNPNRPDCTSALGYLSGAGVAFYLLRALKRRLFDQKLGTSEALDLKELLDCFTIATLTDMVPLVGDNRALVKAGLAQISQTKRPGLRALLKHLNLEGRPLSAQDVAIRFAPKLNALSRMESGLFPIEIYLVDDEKRAWEMVDNILENNSNRVQLQAAGEQEAMELLKEWPHKNFVFICSDFFHRGVVGLIATKVSQSAGCPAFIGSLDEQGIVTGSARLPNGHEGSVLGALKAVAHLMNRCGGHEAAAGFEFKMEQKEAIITEMARHFSLQAEQAAQSLEFDLSIPASQVGESLMKWFEHLGPFGSGFPVPICEITGFKLVDAYDLKGGHLKLKLECDQTGKRVNGLAFSSPIRAESLKSRVGESLLIYGEIQWNYFAGQKSVQILMKDFKTAKSSGG